jgi:hypothetical protein
MAASIAFSGLGTDGYQRGYLILAGGVNTNAGTQLGNAA